MEFLFTEEQTQLRESVRRFLGNVSTPAEVRRLMDTQSGYDTTVWRQLHEDLGLGGIHVPTEYGGAGLGYVELGIVLEEMGRALLCSPYFSSHVLATTALQLTASDDQKTDWLPQLANGSKIGTLAIYEDQAEFDPTQSNVCVKNNRITGSKRLVTDGTVADVFIVASQESSDCLHLVESAAQGLSVVPQDALDPTRKLTMLNLDNVPCRALPNSNAAVVEKLHQIVAGVLANEMIGGAQYLLETSVEYSNQRVQFGRSISSLQAIKHKCANLLLDVELAKSTTYGAMQSLASLSPDSLAHCAMAKAAANEAYLRAAADTIQVHGGIGFTWENDTHLWFKRAKSSEVFLGTSTFQREKYLHELGV